jgi:hypothetical protein
LWDKFEHREKGPKGSKIHRSDDSSEYELQRRLTDAEEGRTDVTSTIADDDTQVNSQPHPHYVDYRDTTAGESTNRRSSATRSPHLFTGERVVNQSTQPSRSHSQELSSPYQISPVSPISVQEISMDGSLGPQPLVTQNAANDRANE